MARWILWCVLAVSGCQDGGGEVPVSDSGGEVPFSDGRLCTLRGCSPAAELALPYAGDEADLDAGTGRVCINQLCADATIAGVPRDGGGIGAHFASGDLLGMVMLWREAGALSVRASVEQYQLALTAGDVYSLAYSAQDGRVLVEGRWAAHAYATSYPNGVECGPMCFTGQLEPLP
ncbi:MAG: hypothetical protein WKG01_09095 [Kofleriaceae bacterium]